MIARNIISIDDLTKDEILEILDNAKKLDLMEDEKKSEYLKNKIVSTMFFEASTRTKLSFESAAQKLGAQILPFDSIASSLSKGESFLDTVRMLESYADILVIRHPNDGAARLATEVSNKPVLNAGDGANQHPSQTLLDLYTIKEEKATLENLTIAFVGDLKYGRTVHSLTKAIIHFNPKKIYFVSPELLKLPNDLLDELDSNNINYDILDDYRECLHEVDVFYMTRIQKERFPDIEDYEKLRGIYVINKENIEGKTKEDMIIMHPLPRVDEISTDLDNTKHALYFKQAKNGIPVRQAMMLRVLNMEVK
jgi:aspartate carbamoyltransferase catalytic subunit